MLRTLSAAVCGTLFLFLPLGASAEEPLFGFVSTTDLLPHGKYEAAQWLTWSDGKPVGQFDLLEGRSEFEYGLSDRLQIAAYLNYDWARAYHDNVITGATLSPATFASVYVGPNEHLNSRRFASGSLEGIYRVLSPYIDPFGLALYLRPSIGPQSREAEARLILQKNFVDDRFVVALNLDDTTAWYDVPRGPGAAGTGVPRAWDTAGTMTFALASSYRFASGWFAGLELLNERDYSGVNPFRVGASADSAYYLGPTLHYANEHMFATLTYLTQLPLASDYANLHPNFVVDGREYSADNTRLRLRLKFGWYF
jgi:hypothetical protein